MSDSSTNSVAKPVDTDVVLEHLRRLDASGMHQLAAIDADARSKAFVSFTLDEGDRARAFLREYGSTHNIFYSANEVRPDLGDARAKKGDILNIRMIGADLDPPKGIMLTPDVLAAEHAKLDAIREKVEKEDEAFYSFAVSSGAGIQLGWYLKEKVPADCFTDEAENLTRGILRRLGAPESTADITRLLRAPGTYNFPGAAKRKQGRTSVVPAKLLGYIDDSTTTLGELAKWAPPVPPSRSTVSVGKRDLDLSIDMAAVDDATATGDVPEALRAKLDHHIATDEKLNRLWHGDKSALGGSDTSGSAFGYALAMVLRRTGNFTPTEYGQLLGIWEHGSENVDERQIARAWVRSNAAAATEEFEECFSLSLRWVEPFEASTIPKRRFIIGRFAARHYLSALISPPGVGKTTFLLMLAVAVVTGRSDITGFKIHERTRVLLWNQEDEHDELNRRLLAVMTAFDVKWADLDIDGKRGLILGSGVDQPFMIAKRDNDRIKASPDAAYIEGLIKDNAIGLAIFDPFVELHPANENDNVEIATVARMFRAIAVRRECAVVLAHHTRKPPNAANRESYAGDMDAGRGAGSLNGVARMVATLYTLDAVTAKKYGLSDAEHRHYVRFDDGKANMSLISDAPTFFKREGVMIGGFGGEEVGVLRPVALGRLKTPAQAKADDDATIKESVRAMLRVSDGHTMPLLEIVQTLLENNTIDLMSEDTLRKRLDKIFADPLEYSSGDIIDRATRSVKGKNGRSAFLTLNVAEKSK
jgi:hypothetical protein